MKAQKYKGSRHLNNKVQTKNKIQKQKQTTSNSIIHDPKAAQDGNKWQKNSMKSYKR
jgi:hypothetical protein